MEMPTTPFEELLLGSEFLPVLTSICTRSSSAITTGPCFHGRPSQCCSSAEIYNLLPTVKPCNNRLIKKRSGCRNVSSDDIVVHENQLPSANKTSSTLLTDQDCLESHSKTPDNGNQSHTELKLVCNDKIVHDECKSSINGQQTLLNPEPDVINGSNFQYIDSTEINKGITNALIPVDVTEDAEKCFIIESSSSATSDKKKYALDLAESVTVPCDSFCSQNNSAVTDKLDSKTKLAQPGPAQIYSSKTNAGDSIISGIGRLGTNNTSQVTGQSYCSIQQTEKVQGFQCCASKPSAQIDTNVDKEFSIENSFGTEKLKECSVEDTNQSTSCLPSSTLFQPEFCGTVNVQTPTLQTEETETGVAVTVSSEFNELCLKKFEYTPNKTKLSSNNYITPNNLVTYTKADDTVNYKNLRNFSNETIACPTDKSTPSLESVGTCHTSTFPSSTPPVPPVALSSSRSNGSAAVTVTATCTVAVLQCRKCGAAFLEAQSALSHFKLHLLVAYKRCFYIARGKNCSNSARCRRAAAASHRSHPKQPVYSRTSAAPVNPCPAVTEPIWILESPLNNPTLTKQFSEEPQINFSEVSIERISTQPSETEKILDRQSDTSATPCVSSSVVLRGSVVGSSIGSLSLTAPPILATSSITPATSTDVTTVISRPRPKASVIVTPTILTGISSVNILACEESTGEESTVVNLRDCGIIATDDIPTKGELDCASSAVDTASSVVQKNVISSFFSSPAKVDYTEHTSEDTNQEISENSEGKKNQKTADCSDLIPNLKACSASQVTSDNKYFSTLAGATTNQEDRRQTRSSFKNRHLPAGRNSSSEACIPQATVPACSVLDKQIVAPAAITNKGRRNSEHGTSTTRSKRSRPSSTAALSVELPQTKKRRRVREAAHSENGGSGTILSEAAGQGTSCCEAAVELPSQIDKSTQAVPAAPLTGKDYVPSQLVLLEQREKHPKEQKKVINDLPINTIRVPESSAVLTYPELATSVSNVASVFINSSSTVDNSDTSTANLSASVQPFFSHTDTTFSGETKSEAGTCTPLFATSSISADNFTTIVTSAPDCLASAATNSCDDSTFVPPASASEKPVSASPSPVSIPIRARASSAPSIAESSAPKRYSPSYLPAKSGHYPTPVDQGATESPTSPAITPPSTRLDQVHFHCNFCPYSASEVLSLPGHMESEHLSFSRQVSLRLQAHPQHLHREYQCGECGKKLQGTMSIIQHLLAHDSDADPNFYTSNAKKTNKTVSKSPLGALTNLGGEQDAAPLGGLLHKPSLLTGGGSTFMQKTTSILASGCKVSPLSSGFTNLPSSLSGLVSKTATPLLSENLARGSGVGILGSTGASGSSAIRTLSEEDRKRLVDLKKWCPEMVSVVAKTAVKTSDGEHSGSLGKRKDEVCTKEAGNRDSRCGASNKNSEKENEHENLDKNSEDISVSENKTNEFDVAHTDNSLLKKDDVLEKKGLEYESKLLLNGGIHDSNGDTQHKYDVKHGWLKKELVLGEKESNTLMIQRQDPDSLGITSNDIFKDKNIELLNVRWITEGLLVDGKDGKGWKVVTSNRIVLDDPIDPLYKVESPSSWRTKWFKGLVGEGETRPRNLHRLADEQAKIGPSWMTANGGAKAEDSSSSLLGLKREDKGRTGAGGDSSGVTFIDGSSGFANGMSSSLADIHRSIGSGGFLAHLHHRASGSSEGGAAGDLSRSFGGGASQTDPASDSLGIKATDPYSSIDSSVNGIGIDGNNGIHMTNSNLCMDGIAQSLEVKSSSEVNSLGVDMMQIEIDPLALLASAIEEDQKSSNPFIPTEHFLLGRGGSDDDYLPGGEDPETYCDGDGYNIDDRDAGEAAVYGYATGGSTNSPFPVIPSSYPHDGSYGSEQQGGYNESSAGVFQCDMCPKAFKYQYLLLSHRRHVHSIVSKPSSASHYQLGKLHNQIQQQKHAGLYGNLLQSSSGDPNSLLQTDELLQQQLYASTSPSQLQDGIGSHQVEALGAGSGPDTAMDGVCHTLDMANVHPSLKSKMSTGLIVNGQVFCPICGKKFVDRASLIAHSVMHIDKTARCKSCGREFASKTELTVHIVKYQGTCDPTKLGKVKCATCGEQLASLAALKEHRRTNHPSPEQQQQQQDREAAGISSAEGVEALSPGLPSIGGETSQPRRGFQCDYCGKNFNCRSNLRDHLVVHTGEKPYPCDICGKTFSFVHNMKTHRLTHNQGRQELCPYCDKSYKSKISLYYHMKKGNCRGLSTTEVPEGYHRCPDCLQMFASEERFSSHKQRGHCHTSHRCHQCGLRCSSQDRLDNHLSRGLCKKDPKVLANPPIKRKRKEKPPLLSQLQGHRMPGSVVSGASGGGGGASVASTDDIICERCNYNRDCCCTFTCPACGKRVFSILAYTHHKQKTCPVVRMRRDKIRSALIEKKKRKEREELAALRSGENGGAVVKKMKVEGGDGFVKMEKCDSESDDEVSNFNLSNFSNLGSSVLGYDSSVIKDEPEKEEGDGHLNSGWLNVDIMEGTKSWEESANANETGPVPNATTGHNRISIPKTNPARKEHLGSTGLKSKFLSKLKASSGSLSRLKIPQKNRILVKKVSEEPNTGTSKIIGSSSAANDSSFNSQASSDIANGSLSISSTSAPASNRPVIKVSCSGFVRTTAAAMSSPFSSPATPTSASLDVLSTSGRRIKKPRKFIESAYDDDCELRDEEEGRDELPRGSTYFKQSNVQSLSSPSVNKRASISKVEILHQKLQEAPGGLRQKATVSGNLTKTIVFNTKANRISNTTISSNIPTATTAPTVLRINAAVTKPGGIVSTASTNTSVSNCVLTAVGGTSGLMSANPGKIITLSSSALSARTKQHLLSLGVKTSGGPGVGEGGHKKLTTTGARFVTLSASGQGQQSSQVSVSSSGVVSQGTPIIINSNQQFIVSSQQQNQPQTVLIPAQSFLIQTSAGPVMTSLQTSAPLQTRQHHAPSVSNTQHVSIVSHQQQQLIPATLLEADSNSNSNSLSDLTSFAVSSNALIPSPGDAPDVTYSHAQ